MSVREMESTEPQWIECNGTNGTNSTSCVAPMAGVSVAIPMVMFTLGLLGNTLALITLYRKRRSSDRPTQRRTPSVFFTLVQGLAWNDLVSTIFTSPVVITIYLNNLRWVGGQSLCNYHGFMMTMFGLAPPSIAFIMALERYLALHKPFFYSNHINHIRARITLVVMWISVMLFSSLPLMGLGSFTRQYPGTWCFINFLSQRPMDVGYSAFFAGLNMCIIAFVVYFNVRVIVTLLRLRVQRLRHDVTANVIGSIEVQMVFQLTGITMVYVICWLPLMIHIMITLIHHNPDFSRVLVFVRLASVNQMIDPWVYILCRYSCLRKLSDRFWRRSFKNGPVRTNRRELAQEDVTSERMREISGLRDTDQARYKL